MFHMTKDPLEALAADAVARGIVKPSFRELKAQAIEQATFSRFASDAHKLAMVGLLCRAFGGEEPGDFRVFIDDHTGVETIMNAARVSRAVALAIRDDFMACKAVELVAVGSVGIGGAEARIVWPRAAQ
jgi:hypothetical protein